MTCDDAAKNVFAWEYDDERGSCGCKVDYYGCLNSRPVRLQRVIRTHRDELVLPRVRGVSRADSFDRLSQGVPLRPQDH